MNHLTDTVMNSGMETEYGNE